jgi:hypothetical protein
MRGGCNMLHCAKRLQAGRAREGKIAIAPSGGGPILLCTIHARHHAEFFCNNGRMSAAEPPLNFGSGKTP